MPGRARNNEQREADLAELAGLYLRGVPLQDIAAKQGVSPPQITYDIKEIHKRWRESSIVDFNEAKQRELSKIDAVEEEAWAAWRRTIGVKKKYKFKAGGKDGDVTERMRWDDAGDPRFLLVIHGCIEKRCAILGINAPMKVAPTDPSGKKPYKAEVSQLSDDELRIIQRMRSIVSGDQCESN